MADKYRAYVGLTEAQIIVLRKLISQAQASEVDQPGWASPESTWRLLESADCALALAV